MPNDWILSNVISLGIRRQTFWSCIRTITPTLSFAAVRRQELQAPQPTPSSNLFPICRAFSSRDVFIGCCYSCARPDLLSSLLCCTKQGFFPPCSLCHFQQRLGCQQICTTRNINNITTTDLHQWILFQQIELLVGYITWFISEILSLLSAAHYMVRCVNLLTYELLVLILRIKLSQSCMIIVFNFIKIRDV